MPLLKHEPLYTCPFQDVDYLIIRRLQDLVCYMGTQYFQVIGALENTFAASALGTMRSTLWRERRRHGVGCSPGGPIENIEGCMLTRPSSERVFGRRYAAGV